MKKKASQNHLIAQLEAQSKARYQSNANKRGRDGIVYTRVSSQEQAENNGSLEVQRKYCDNYAKNNNITIKEYFGGTYESAKTDGRKEFKRMVEYARKHQNISFIIIFNYDRFSRTGAGASKLSEDLGKEGIILKSVTQDIDTTTAIGRLQENFFHLLNNFDNRLKSDRTIINTREVMLKGYWPYPTPLGYKNLKPKHRACFHEYVITEEGRYLKKGFQMIREGKLLFIEIVDYLQKRGVHITKTSFRHVFSNPFYAGYVTGKLVNGELIKGQHPALIDLKLFMEVQEILKGNPIAGVPKVFRHDEIPLKTFAKDEISGAPLTGYKTKGNWYYKIKEGAVPVNVSAKRLNGLFVTLLSQYEYDRSRQSYLKKTLTEIIRQHLSEKNKDGEQLKKRLSEKKSMLEKVEQKFINDEISKEIYEKHSEKLTGEIAELSKELETVVVSGSNLEIAVEKCLSISQNISQAWVSAEYEQKQRLQRLVFPEGILYNKQKGEVRTERVNSLFAAIPLLAKVSDEKEKGDSSKNRLKCSKVPRTGFEPAHPCGRCDLNTVRLPISPSGHSGSQI
jgi:site-specific DNA recombinase